MNDHQTIISQITSPGKSSVGIIRISGCKANMVANKILGKIPTPRLATYARFLDQNNKTLDEGLFLWFPKPASFTGEDVLEFQGHGSPFLMDLLIQRILSMEASIRLAEPGEFSKRAFLNGKIDLLQAEAIDDLINAETDLCMRASLNSLQGKFSFYIHELMQIIIKLRMHLETSIDFSEENNSLNLNQLINMYFLELEDKFLKIKIATQNGMLLKEGKKIVIAGAPNSGKSSLLNILSNSNRAIVTDIPGTTRDLLDAQINVNGVICSFIDTAGLRDTDNKIEKIGIMRAWKEIKKSDHVLFVVDQYNSISDQKKISYEFIKKIPNNIRVTLIFNKSDLSKSLVDTHSVKKSSHLDCINISALTGEGIETLRKHIIDTEIKEDKHSIFIARRRHMHQITLAFNEFIIAKKNWKLFNNIELLAESFKIINTYLGEIIGRFTSDDLLKNIFSNFCIGK